MGLLDMFSNLDPNQTQGLLAAASKMMELSGPSLVPRSFGQIAGASYGAYNGAVNAAQDRQQQQELMGLKIKDAQSDFDNQELVRTRDSRIAQRLQGLRGAPTSGDGTTAGFGADITGGAATSGLMNPQGLTPASHMNGSVFTDAAARAGLPDDMSSLNSIVDLVNRGQDPLQAALSIAGKSKADAPDMTQTMASAMPGGAMSPKTGGPDWMQAYQQQNGMQLPMQPPARVASAGAQGSAPAPNLTQNLVARMTQEAQIRSEEGDLAGANKLYEQAVKFMPEVNKIEVGQDRTTGQAINVITYKDGRQEVSQFAPKPDIHFADDGQHTAIPIDGYTGKAMGTGIQRQASPESVLANRQAQSRLAFDVRQAAGSDGAPLTQGAIDNAAARYLVDGTLPPMGMGAAGTQGRTAILNKAAELAAATGKTGDQQRWDQLGNKGVAAARTATLRDFSPAGKSGQALTAANTALNHLATIRELAQAQNNRDIPAFNKIANEIAQATGNPAPTTLQAAITMVAPEVSKAVIGQTGGQEERATFARNFNPNASPQQTVQGVGVIEDLLGGRLTESQRAYERGTKQTDFADTMLSPAAQQVLARARQHMGQAGAPNAQPGLATTQQQNPTAPQQRVAMLPSAAQAKGRRYRADNGTVYRSDGTTWIKE